MNKQTRRIVVAACIALAAGRNAGQAVTLVEEGKAQGVIVLPQAHSPTLLATAQDLQNHFHHMSGTIVPIRTKAETTSGPAVYLGCGTDLTVPREQVWPDGYRLRVTEEAIYILAPREEGIRNGVYGLLEDHLGCRWFTMGEIGAVIPRRQTIALPELDEVQKPYFEMRSPWHNGNVNPRTAEEGKQRGLWGARNRRGGMRGYAGHNWYIIFPKERQEQEPDLAPFYNGKRNPGEGQICLSNPKAVEIAAQYFIQLFHNDSELDFYSLSQNDGAGWCECEDCQALGSNNAARMLIFSNRVAEKVAAVHTHKGLAILPYAGTIEPPEEDLQGHPNLYPMICSYSMEQVRPLGHGFRRRVERWMTMLPRAWCYDYIGWYPGPWTLFHNLEADQSLYRQLGYTGNMSEYMGRNIGTDLFMWLSLKLAWNPDRKVDDLLDEFYPAYFGPAAVVMREIYEGFEQHMLSVGGTGEAMDVPRLYPVQMVEEALAKMDAAKAGVEDETIRARLERDENCLRLTRLYLDFWAASARFRRSGNAEDQQQVAESGQAYLGLIRKLDGTLTVGGSHRNNVESTLASLNDPGTVFTEAGQFGYGDGLDDGGKSYQALRRSGLFIGVYGLALAPNATGEIVYDFRAGEGLAFQEARLVGMYFSCPDGGHNRIEISRDGGQTWVTAYEDVSMSGGMAEYDLTKHIAGANPFLLRFWVQNGPQEILAMDKWGIQGTIGPAQ